MTYDPHQIAAVFGRAAATYDTVLPFFGEFGARLVELAGLRRGESVLDVGCGRGATLLPAAERVGPEGTVLGVDLAEEMVTLLGADIAARGLSGASVRQMDVQALEVDSGSFDVVLCSFVLHLLPDPAQAAGAMVRALRVGGRCVAASPTGARPDWEFLGPLFGDYAKRAGVPMVMPFRPDFDLAGLLAAAGLDVTVAVTERVEFHFADEQTWWDWAWTQGMRALFEALTPADLDSLREQLFAELRARRTGAGIPMAQTAAFVVAEKRAG